MASFITVAADINGSVTLRLDPSTSDKVFNREMVNSAMAEVQQIIENHYRGQLKPFSDVIANSGVAASKSPVDLPLRLDHATASPTTPQGQHQ